MNTSSCTESHPLPPLSSSLRRRARLVRVRRVVMMMGHAPTVSQVSDIVFAYSKPLAFVESY